MHRGEQRVFDSFFVCNAEMDTNAFRLIQAKSPYSNRNRILPIMQRSVVRVVCERVVPLVGNKTGWE